MPVTFTPAYAPSPQSTSRDDTPRVLRSDFGDGYSQRARDGINFSRRTVTLQWDALAATDADVIEAFFAARGGTDAFYYTLPLESTPYLWTAGKVHRGYVSANVVLLSVPLTQEFDLV